MNQKLTSALAAFSLFISAALLFSSCNTVNSLSGQPHYHLQLVKAPVNPAQVNRSTTTSVADIAPMPQQSSTIADNGDNALKPMNNQLKTEMSQPGKKIKKSEPVQNNKIKRVITPNSTDQLASSSYKNVISATNSVNATEDYGNGAHFFTLFLIFLILAIILYILAFGSPIFYIFAVICNVAAVIFFILWIVSLA